ncbi:MAG: YheU family protein [Pseudomonadales bacterium]|nr:YheU family protein [Pseudomonadales bacterium]
MEIPYQQLSADALCALIEEFVSRDGTDYGEQELSLEQKVVQVEDLLRKGLAVIVFDSDTESCDIVVRN